EESMRVERIKEILDQTIDMEEEKQCIDKQLHQLEEENEQLLEKLAILREDLERLEHGGTYAESFHRLNQEKDRFEEHAHSWAVYRLAEHFLEKIKEKYRKERLPQVIQSASEYFSI